MDLEKAKKTYEKLQDYMANDLYAQIKDVNYKYSASAAVKYYCLLEYYLSLTSKRAKTYKIEKYKNAEQEIAELLVKYDQDTKVNGWTPKRGYTWEILAYYCREYKRIYKGHSKAKENK